MMTKKFEHMPRRKNHLVVSVLLLVVTAALLGTAILLVRTRLLQNTQNLGSALARSYALEEELLLDNMEKNVMLASQYIEELQSNETDLDEMQHWIRGYFSKLINILGEGAVDPYAVVDGKIIAANPWDGDEDDRYQDTMWYQQALEAEGEPVCSDAYTDVISGKRVVTISQELSNEGDVFAMDVFIQQAKSRSSVLELPEEYSYYLCDQDGLLIYAVVDRDLDEQTLQTHADYLIGRVHDGSLYAYDSTFEDLSGVSRGAYYYQMNNGWTVIITIPVRSMLIGDPNMAVYFMAATASVLFVSMTYLVIRDAFQSRKIKRADDTAHMLGDSFYAIFRVNFQEGTYEAIKMHNDTKDCLSGHGDYAQVMQTMHQLVKSNTYHTFEVCFSLENIRQRVQEGIRDYGGDYQRLFGDSYRWVNVRTLYDPKRAPDEVILCFRDVDTEKRQELQHTILLQEALETAKKSTKAKNEFFSRMSHDMRTPLNAILGCCELAQKTRSSQDSGKVWDYLGKIQFAGKQLLSLINDILELSRLEAGKNALDESVFDLKELLTSTAEIFRENAQSENKSLEISIDLQNPTVRGDEKKIAQILNNLLSNAVKYSRPGDSIHLEARQFDFQKHSKYQIVVEDTGIGMTPAFLEHLFEPYARETAFTSQHTVGTGLGMPIVKSLVQQMSGEITVQSKLGEGSRFTVTIPLRAVAAQEVPEQEPAPGQEEAFDWSGRTVLLAEDNELNREIATELLEQLGARILPAENGEEAVRVFSETSPYCVDVILMDMQMPVMDGCQAAEAIRNLNRPDAATVPIIAVTANAFSEDIARTTKAGMNAHVAKPLDILVLTQTMQKLMGCAYPNCQNQSAEGDENHG